MGTVNTEFVKCPNCGWLHFAVSEAEARAAVEDFNRTMVPHYTDKPAKFNAYLICMRCGADSATFLPAVESDAPSGVTISAVVVTR